MSAIDAGGPAAGGATPTRIVIGIGGLYVAQSVVGGVIFQGLPAVMRQSGASLNDIAFILLTVLPWSFKFLWSPPIERWRSPRLGRRRSRRIVGIVGCFTIGSITACALIGPTALGPLTVAMMVASFSTATIDIACDGHAVESLSEQHRGWGNAVQVGGAYLGSAIGGGVFLVLVDHLGWTPSSFVMVAVLIALALPFLTMRDDAVANRPEQPPQSLMAALKRREVRTGLALVSLYTVGQKWSMTLIAPLQIDSGLSLSQIGALQGVGVTALGLLGALYGGYVVRRFGAFRVMGAAMAAQALALAGFALFAYLASKSGVAIVALTLFSSGALALGFTALYAELMGRASLAQAGVDFTLFQSMDAIVSVIGWQLVGSFGDRMGFAWCFGIAAGLAIVSSIALPRMAKPGSRA